MYRGQDCHKYSHWLGGKGASVGVYWDIKCLISVLTFFSCHFLCLLLKCPMALSYYSLSTLSWRGRKTDKIRIHLTESGSNQRHVIFDGR